MSNHNNYYSFVFRGLLTEQALDKAGRKNKALFDEVEADKLADRLGLKIMEESYSAKARKMAIIYTAFSTFENTVREFVSKSLLEEKGEDWWEQCVPEKIKKSAEIRKLEEERFRVYSPRGESLINFVDFGDLMSIIQKEENWPTFEPFLPNIEWGRAIMDVLERSRNTIMHSGYLNDKDIERVGINIRDWLQQVGG
jgi:hypothetical protein